MQKILKIARISEQDRLLALFYMLFSVFVASMAVGINVVSFPAILLKNGVSSFFIGLSATNEIVFGVVAALLVGRLAKKLSASGAIVAISVIYASVIYSIFFYQNYLLWILMSGLTGACWVALYVVRQAWVNNIISDENRSVVLALTTTIFCSGFIGGSFIVNYFGALNHQSLMTSSALILLAALLTVLIRATQPKNVESEMITVRDFVKKLPNESLARFLLDLQAGTVICLGVVFGVRIGLTTENAGFLLAGFMASGLFDLYAGFLVKKLNRYRMISAGFLGNLAVVVLMLNFYDNYWVLWGCFFLFGSFCALIMIATLTIVNESYEETQLVAANGAFQAIGSVGSFFGCLLGGVALEFLDFYGFFVVICLANLIYIFYYCLGGPSKAPRRREK